MNVQSVGSMVIVHGASVAWVGLFGGGVHGMCVHQICMHVKGVHG
jgi:hypothetical protein